MKSPTPNTTLDSRGVLEKFGAPCRLVALNNPTFEDMIGPAPADTVYVPEAFTITEDTVLVELVQFMSGERGPRDLNPWSGAFWVKPPLLGSENASGADPT